MVSREEEAQKLDDDGNDCREGEPLLAGRRSDAREALGSTPRRVGREMEVQQTAKSGFRSADSRV